MAAIQNNQFNHSDSHAVRRRNKYLYQSIGRPHNRFNLLAEYLFESGLSESFTASALLRDIIEHLLDEYHDGLVAYENIQSLNGVNSKITKSPNITVPLHYPNSPFH